MDLYGRPVRAAHSPDRGERGGEAALSNGYEVDLSSLEAAGKALTEAGGWAQDVAGRVHKCRANVQFTDGSTLDDLLRGDTENLPLRKLEGVIARMTDLVERRQVHVKDELEYAGQAMLKIKALYARADGQEG
ncbi:hypothetical protein GCM10022380_66140 [Amycolatopsis tucumanensis]|uniref:Uncharacterized protein n=1 Tax=Amycolatopsis tucumanensis TaxID=401106 RepID=A0ABP7JAM0_9PSEU